MSLENRIALLERPASPHLGLDDLRDDGRVARAPGVTVVRGRHAVADMGPVLMELSLRSGQTGVMDALEVLLDAPAARVKIPHLVLVGVRGAVEPEEATADNLAGVVLIYEYRIAGRGTGVFATDDLDGERNVIAPAEIRTEVAEIACRTLVDAGAIVAMISLEGSAEAVRRPMPEAGIACRMAMRRRQAPRYLLLGDTFDSTLARLGDDTRRNLRRYRRRVERDFGAQFEANVEMSFDEFLAMNRASTHPLEKGVAAWRYDLLKAVAAPVFCGVRSTDGQWLSLLGGRRRPGVIDIDWQMNLAGLPRYSLSTVMRSFLLEHEIAQGTGRLMFVGGTPHPMRHSFVCADALDVIVQRRSASAWLLRRLSGHIFPEKNSLGQALRDETLHWTDW
jgi:hypothetical protein